MLVEADSNGYEKISPIGRHFFMIIVSISTSYFAATIFTNPLIIFGLPSLYLFIIFLSHFVFVFTFFEPLTTYRTKPLYIFSDLVKNSNKFPIESKLFHDQLKKHDFTDVYYSVFINELNKLEIFQQKKSGL